MVLVSAERIDIKWSLAMAGAELCPVNYSESPLLSPSHLTRDREKMQQPSVRQLSTKLISHHVHFPTSVLSRIEIVEPEMSWWHFMLDLRLILFHWVTSDKRSSTLRLMKCQRKLRILRISPYNIQSYLNLNLSPFILSFDPSLIPICPSSDCEGLVESPNSGWPNLDW